MWGGRGVGVGWMRFGCWVDAVWVLEMQEFCGKRILCNWVLLGMIGKSLFCIAVKGAGFALVNTRHVPHMFYDLGQ